MYKRPLEVLIFGTGAVGSTFGWRLAQNPFVRVSTVCRSNYNNVKNYGIHLQTALWGDGSFRPHRVVKAVRDVQRVIFDYVVCANKLLPGDAIPFTEAIRPAVRPTTTLVSVQNGINVEQSLKHVFQGRTVLSAICYVSCQQPRPGHVQQLSQIRPHGFAIGTYHPGSADIDVEDNKLQTLVSLDKKFRAIEDVNTERWTKMMFNGALNPVSALTGLDSHQLVQDSPSLTLAYRVAEEIYKVAIKSGAIFSEDIISRTISSMETSARIVPSMLQDARNGRQMEVEALCGNVCRQADAVGVLVPAVKSMYIALAKMNREIEIVTWKHCILFPHRVASVQHLDTSITPPRIAVAAYVRLGGGHNHNGHSTNQNQAGETIIEESSPSDDAKNVELTNLETTAGPRDGMEAAEKSDTLVTAELLE